MGRAILAIVVLALALTGCAQSSTTSTADTAGAGAPTATARASWAASKLLTPYAPIEPPARAASNAPIVSSSGTSGSCS